MSGPLIAHRSAGSGPPLLLLNGGLMSMASWEPIAGVLESHYTVHRCDLRGQLRSPGEPPAHLSGHVADVAALLDALEIPALHVVGTSFGGLVGLLLAAEQPARVRSLAAVTTTERITPEAWQAVLPVLAACEAAIAGGDGGIVFDMLLPATFSPHYLNCNAALLAQRRSQIAGLPRTWFTGLAGLLRSLETVDLTAALPRIACPTLVVAAANDLTFPPVHSEALAERIVAATLEVVPDSGHALVAERPEALLGTLEAFLTHVGSQEQAP